MKTIFYLTVFSLMLSLQASAEANLKLQQKNIQRVIDLESQGYVREALLEASAATDAIIAELGVEATVAQIETQLTKIRNEIITESYSTGGGFNLLSGLISGTTNRSWDVTQIITVNPLEVANFPARVAN